MIGGLLQLLDVPGSMVRDTLALRNPLDQLLHPLSHQDRGLSTSGSELLGRYGMDEGMGRSVGGFAAEIATDPLTWVGGGALLNVPDSLMGFATKHPELQKSFDELGFPYQLEVDVTFPGTDMFTDAVKGMNARHALEGAKRNWEGALHIGGRAMPQMDNESALQALLRQSADPISTLSLLLQKQKKYRPGWSF